MAAPVLCHRSRIVHANCDTCGQRPEVVHKLTNSGGASYCGNCCPVCKSKPAAMGNDPVRGRETAEDRGVKQCTYTPSPRR
jgi:hypothetical protein